MLRHKTLYVVLALLLVLSAMLGCAAPAQTTPTQETTSNGLATNQILRMNLSAGEPQTLDPSLAEDSNSKAVLAMLNQGLMRFKPDLTVEPALAKSVDVSSNGKTYTFTLRDDIKYSDGQPIKAQDFVYAFKRLADPRTASSYSTIIAAIKGAAEFTSADVSTDAAQLQDLANGIGVSAPDDKTVKIELNASASYFLDVCALWNTVPLRQDIIEKYGDTWTEAGNMVSSGPFILKTWEHQSKIVLVPNPYYYGTKRTLREIDVSMITDQKAELEAFKAGELDICQQVPSADVAAIKADPELSKLYRQDTSLDVAYIGFDTSRPPFDNKKLRQAISYAIDRQALVDVVYSGVNVPATSLIPPGVPGYDQNLGFTYDVNKAKQLLAEAGYPDGKGLGTITLSYNSPPVPGHKPSMEYIQDQLKKNLGIDVKLEAAEPSAYLAELVEDTPSMFRMAWNGDYAHAQDFLDLLFRSTSEQNFGKYQNKDFDALLDQAAMTTDTQKQTELYQQAQQLLVDDAPVVFLYYYGNPRLVKPWVQNFITTSQDGDYGGVYFIDQTKIAAH